jgi:predicted DNA-binding transcriptional regulator AlpA
MAEPARSLDARWPVKMRRQTAAASLDISPATFDKLVSRGKLPRPEPVPETSLVVWDRDKLWAAAQDWSESTDDEALLADE